MVYRHKLCAIATSCLLLLPLCSGWGVTPCAGRCQLGSGRLGSGSAIAAVEAGAAGSHVVDDGPAVDIGDIRRAYVTHCGVIIKESIAPVSAQITDAKVAEAIVNPAVETDHRAPIAGIPHVHALLPCPVPRSPERAHEGRWHPCAGHPVVAVNRVPGPVTGRPEVAGTGADRLRIHG